MQVVGSHSMLYCVVVDGSMSNANGLESCHAGWLEAILEVLAVDEAVLPRHGHSGAPSAGMVCAVVSVVSLLQATDGTDTDIVNFYNNQDTLACLQSASSLLPLYC